MYNIYALDNDPVVAATYLADAHLDVLLNERVKILGYIFSRHMDEPEKVLAKSMCAYTEDKAYYALMGSDKKPHHIEIPRMPVGTLDEGGIYWAGSSYNNLAWTIENTWSIARERASRYKKPHRLHMIFVDWKLQSVNTEYQEHTSFPGPELHKLDEVFIEIQKLLNVDTHNASLSALPILMNRIHYAYNLARFGSYKKSGMHPLWIDKLNPAISILRLEVMRNTDMARAAKTFVTYLNKEFPHPLTDLTT